MLLLTNTAHVFRVVTDAAIAINVFANYVDKSGVNTFTPGNQATSINTATTTTVVSAPGASTQRNVKELSIQNTSTTTALGVIVEFYDGINAYKIYKAIIGPSGQLSYEDQSGWTLITPGGSVTQQVFSVAGAGTYTTPAGVRAIKVECIGGGGAGGGCTTAATNSAAGGGGGSGAYAQKIIAAPAASYAYTVGAAGAAASGANGGAGGDTSFDTTTVVAKGGSGGNVDGVTTIHIGGLGGLGGLASASAGDFTANGGPGQFGLALAAAQSVSGNGGDSTFGGSALAVRNATSAGTAATSGGGGGSGSTIISGGASNAGGAGSPGLIIVTEYR